MTDLIEKACESWAKAQVVYLMPSYGGVPEPRAWVEELSKLPAVEPELEEILNGKNHMVVAYALLTLEKMRSSRLKSAITRFCHREEKITLMEGSFSISMDLGGLARRIRKKLAE